ncbi:MAG TPA: hypothetical protein VHO95_08185, partial [Candidatus Dormibacteraeota bacterium]|nr:hypothetical protein [Candidatus Dormibacteraeota bacterium]
MRFALAAILVLVAACGAVAPHGVNGSPLSEPQLKFAVMDAVGKPVYCDPDFYPLAREGGEQASALELYPQIRADLPTYAAITAHEHVPSGDLTDAQKLIVYRAWKLLRVVALTATPAGDVYTFQYRVMNGSGYDLVSGNARVDGLINVTSRTASGPPMCPICLAASTLIATPVGPVRVTDVRVGTVVW